MISTILTRADGFWGRAAFVGGWTADEMALFAMRVAELYDQEHPRSPERADEPEPPPVAS